MATTFNYISKLIASDILSTPEISDRRLAIQYFIKVAKSLYAGNNFEGFALVMSALNQGSVIRLKRTWKLVDPKLTETFHFLDLFMSYENNYWRYRRFFGSQYPNVIPWMAVLLRDLRFCYEGNPKMVGNGEFNYELIIMLGKILIQVFFFSYSLLLFFFFCSCYCLLLFFFVFQKEKRGKEEKKKEKEKKRKETNK